MSGDVVNRQLSDRLFGNLGGTAEAHFVPFLGGSVFYFLSQLLKEVMGL